jgi:hypothetical protein
MQRRPLITALAVSLAVIGCGDGIKRVRVQGKLTAKGEPVRGAFVQFIPEGSTPGEGGIGQADKEGTFTLAGVKGVQGVSPGEYRVRISRLVMPDGTPLPYGATEADNPGCWESIPMPYGGPQSTLKFTVPNAGGSADIDIPAKLLGRNSRIGRR